MKIWIALFMAVALVSSAMAAQNIVGKIGKGGGGFGGGNLVAGGFGKGTPVITTGSALLVNQTDPALLVNGTDPACLVGGC